jgi:hypothetical protein
MPGRTHTEWTWLSLTTVQIHIVQEKSLCRLHWEEEGFVILHSLFVTGDLRSISILARRHVSHYKLIQKLIEATAEKKNNPHSFSPQDSLTGGLISPSDSR